MNCHVCLLLKFKIMKNLSHLLYSFVSLFVFSLLRYFKANPRHCVILFPMLKYASLKIWTFYFLITPMKLINNLWVSSVLHP